MTDRRRAPHPLTIVHLVGMLALVGWWGWYFWQHSPARDGFENAPQRHAVHRRSVSAIDLRQGAGAELGGQVARTATALHAVAVDVAVGLTVLVLFGVATGVYVRRFEIWLQARGSGEAMSLAGTGLSDKALAANVDRGARR